MNINHALQGLLGGVNSGIGQFIAQRDQAEQDALKVRQIQVAEAQAKREAQAQEFNQRKQAYDALMGPLSQEDISPFVQSGFKFTKNADGTFSRPLGAQEQSQIGAAGLDQQKIAEVQRQMEGRKALAANPDLPYEKQAQIAVSYGIDPKELIPSLDYIGQKAAAEDAPRVAGQIKVAEINNAGDMARQKLANEGSLAVAQTNYNRYLDMQAARPASPQEEKIFNDWFLQQSYLNPRFKEAFAAAKQSGNAMDFQADAFKEWRRIFGGRQPQE